MLGRLHVIPPLFSKVEMEFGTAQDSARDLAEHFGVWLKRGVKKKTELTEGDKVLFRVIPTLLFCFPFHMSPKFSLNICSCLGLRFVATFGSREGGGKTP